MELPVSVIEDRLFQEINNRDLMGYEIDGLLSRWKTAQGNRSALMALHDDLKKLKIRTQWPYREPSDLVSIRKERPSAVELPPFYLSEQEIRSKIRGGWFGRAAGCILGKPLELGWNMEEIRAYLEGANAFPLHDYVPSQSRYNKILRRDCAPSMRGYVQYAQEDDDLNYSCLAVKLLENYGIEFSTLDVGINWLNSIPFLWTWGPEHVVYLNLATQIGDHQPEDIDVEEIASYLNPGLEYIGAQIRADVYGYVCPGLPEKAGELAWKDAYLDHRASGIYGAIWVAAMNSAAFTAPDIETVIRVGLSQVPANSRFTEAIEQVIEWYHMDQDWWITGHRIAQCYGQYTMAGTINNAAIVAAALLYGWGDGTDSPMDIYERAITTAVQMGFDTDCNGGTVGSIIGVKLGAELLPQKWISPLHDTLRTCVAEFGQVHLTEMADRCYEISRIIRFSLKTSCDK